MTIENCLTISITDLKKAGLFNDTKNAIVVNFIKEAWLWFFLLLLRYLWVKMKNI